MKATEALREIMKVKGIRPCVLRNRLGMDASRNSVLMMRLTQENISVGKLNEMLRVMDYKLVVMPSSERISGDSYEVE